MTEVLIHNNVNQHYPDACRFLRECGVWEDSRGGSVLTAHVPVMTVTLRSTQRILFSERRDANPFFGIAESVWMLAGRRDGRWLDQYVRDFSSRYGEPDGTIHDAYGFRWRDQWGNDQLVEIVDRLRKDPKDRRVVLAMWDPDSDLWPILAGTPVSIPCNTHIYPRIVQDRLDLTVCCRSNDMIWGALGSNIVHFSFLQEYLATAVGTHVGVLYQLSNNYHVYEKVWERRAQFENEHDPYASRIVQPRPLVTDPERFLEDCESAVDNADGGFSNDWFSRVWIPLRDSYRQYRAGDLESAVMRARDIGASDIRVACEQWLARRIKREDS